MSTKTRVPPKTLRRRNTFALFQDGAPSKGDAEVLLHSLSLIARGNGQRDIHREKSMNDVRHAVGLYSIRYPLAQSLLEGSLAREFAFKEGGTKQMNHIRGTDGWFRSMLVLEVRAIDDYILPWIFISFNGFLAPFLSEVVNISISSDALKQWNEVFSVVMKTSLAFLLVFRLNRCAMRFWEARGLWGNVTHLTRNLVGGLLMYGNHLPSQRDLAIRWAASFCVAAMHFIRSEHEYNPDELQGVLTSHQIHKLQDASHAPLHAASMVRFYLRKIFKVDASTPPAIAHAQAIQLDKLDQYVSDLVTQVSGMEKIRSTPLPIAYVTHLRTLLFLYCLLLPYVWVQDWKWTTLPLVAFTAFALLGIEGVSSEVEIPFDRSRPNHLALDAYCLVILNSVQGLVVHEANLDMQGGEGEGEDSVEKGVQKIFKV